MARYIALLRAVNVGGRTVRMQQLRVIFEELGFDDVETFIASGNVIFEARGAASTLERRIESSLEHVLGFSVATFLRTPDELGQAVAASPFRNETPGALYIGFAARPFAAAAAARIQALDTDVDCFAVFGRHVYWRGLTGMGQSKVTGAAVEKALGAPVTFRSITTARTLAVKYTVGARSRERAP